MNGGKFGGRAMTVNEAKPPENRPRSGEFGNPGGNGEAPPLSKSQYLEVTKTEDSLQIRSSRAAGCERGWQSMEIEKFRVHLQRSPRLESGRVLNACLQAASINASPTGVRRNEMSCYSLP
jgi:hypothetical protein